MKPLLPTTGRLFRAQAGFTRLELGVICILCAILFVTYLRSVRYYQEQIEQVVVSMTLSSIRMGMAQEWADRITKGNNRQGVKELNGANPIRWLEFPPQGYLGEMKSLKPEQLNPGGWYFDLGRRELVYRVSLSAHLEMRGDDDIKLLRWTITLAQNGKNEQPEFGDLVLEPVHAYQWF